MGSGFRLALIFVALLAWAPVVNAQEIKVNRVAVFRAGKIDLPQLRGLRDGLKDAGYIEGKNLLIDSLQRETFEKLRPIVKVYTQHKIDVIVTTNSMETKIAKEATQEIPIVFLTSSNPMRRGFIKSIARPATNITGLTYITAKTRAKHLEVFKQAVPTLQRVAVIYDEQEPKQIQADSLGAVGRVATSLGVKLTKVPVDSLIQAEQELSSISSGNTDGIFILCTSLFIDLEKISRISRRKRLPLFVCAAEQVSSQGGLITYAPDLYLIGRRAAWYVDRILKGEKPHNLPVESPTKFELVINLKTAKEIGLTIPPEVLMLADKVIK